MLRHIGKRRNFDHNLRLAILLCLNAGFINAAGFIAFSVLTTNVTGHAALLAVNLSEGHWRTARMAALWLFLFFLGAFTSASLIGRTGKDRAASYSTPIMIIVGVLTAIMLGGGQFDGSVALTELFAGTLLFAMGAQNAMVSMISGSVVRTTHLTGMVTDLGVDVSAWLSGNSRDKNLRRRLLLRAMIVLFFLLGGLSGGLLFLRLGFLSFCFPVGILLITLFYDYSRVGIRKMAARFSRGGEP